MGQRKDFAYDEEHCASGNADCQLVSKEMVRTGGSSPQLQSLTFQSFKYSTLVSLQSLCCKGIYAYVICVNVSPDNQVTNFNKIS
jgi:hypothetical protein